MSKLGYHYTACGLDNIYLSNGYELHTTDYGEGVSIRDADNLHEVIGRSIVTSAVPIRGQELRFLRAQMEFSQAAMARFLGVDKQSIKRWEKAREKNLNGTADRALRQFYALKMCGDETARRICELLDEIDEIEHRLTTFYETEGHWAEAA